MTTEPAERALALARHHLELGQAQRALERLEAVGPRIEDAEFWELRAEALLRLRRFDDASRAAQEGLRVDGDSIVLLDVLALAQAELGKLEAAERALLAALRLEPEHSTLLCHYAELLARGGQLQKGLRVFAEAERIDPTDPDVLRTGAFLGYLEADDKKAARYSRRMLEEDPENPAGHGLLGAIAAERGSLRSASRHLRQAALHDLSNAALVDAARHTRASVHPLYWPLWPFARFGPAKTWVAAIALFALLTAIEQYTLLAVAWITYLALCVYSWVAPPLLNRWIGRAP